VCDARGLEPRDVVGACLRGGARLLQVRWKQGHTSAFLSLADQIVRSARVHGARVIVNDRADIARMADADGVHVGQEDLEVEAARAVVGEHAIVGLSTHTREQVDAALSTSASYVAVGPIFTTATKDTGYDARGLDLVAYAAGRGKPIVAIGGITLERAPDVIAAGAAAVAVISDLLTDDIEQRVRAFVSALPARPFKV
jgi:thiamine-phosphate pyrophosphorylase